MTAGSAPPEYNSNPPTSGPHAPNTVRCGIHSEPVPDVVGVHNLEHGVVLIQYLPSISAAELAGLTEAIAALPNHAVLAPRPANPAPITLTAWTVLLSLEEVDTEAVRWFWETYRQEGPEQADCPIQPGVNAEPY